MKWIGFAITKLTLCLVFGILFGYYFPVLPIYIIIAFLGIFLLLLLFYLKARRQLFQQIWFGFFALITTFFLGIAIELFHQQQLHDTHYSHFLQNDHNSYVLSVREVLKPTRYHDRYVCHFNTINSQKASGKLMVHIAKDSLVKKLTVDEIIYATEPLKVISNVRNPSTFDYKTYLNKRHIFHQLFLKKEQYIRRQKSTQTVYGLAAGIRNTIYKNLQFYGFKGDELAVINALLLGQRHYLSKELQAEYANAGAIHILAISGLHIGILVMLLQFLFRPLKRFRNGNLFSLILTLAILWSFAFISGMSASVVRAVCMFTAFVLASHLKRPTNTFQLLMVSMFFLLLFNPHFLFDVGFQLSYAAVFSIVWLAPLWKRLWNPQFFIFKSIWSLLTVSIAAQLGVLPLSLYYFHQFPSLFFITNLTLIPVLGFILVLGICVIVLAYLNQLPLILANLYIEIIENMNAFVSWVASHERFLFQDIFISANLLLAFYIIMITCIHFLHFSTRKNSIYLCLGILCCQGLLFMEKTIQQPNRELVVFHQNRETVLGNRFQQQTYVHHSLDSISIKKKAYLKAYKQLKKSDTLSFNSIKNIYKLGDEYVFVVDSLGIYKVKNIPVDYVLLRQSPKINLYRLIDSIQPKTIIADGSNYKSYIALWKHISNVKKIPFHYTGEKGAFFIKK